MKIYRDLEPITDTVKEVKYGLVENFWVWMMIDALMILKHLSNLDVVARNITISSLFVNTINTRL